jgi:hypothetical protein
VKRKKKPAKNNAKKKHSKKTRRRQTRDEQVEEAKKIEEWISTYDRFCLDLIYEVALRANSDYPGDAAVVVLDLSDIALVLEWCDADGLYQQWEHYRQHFESDQKQKTFFEEVNDLGRAVALLRLDERTYNRPIWAEGLQVPWNDSLMPRELMAPIARLTTMYPGVLEDFLPKFFASVAKMDRETSTHTRAMIILMNVSAMGWSAEKHTDLLIQRGFITPSIDGSEVERVKKFIRDLRARYRRHVRLMKPFLKPIAIRQAARKGTS